MPLYEYYCDSCDRSFEVTQKFDEAPLQACPECGAEVRKLMSLGGFSLKGQGWFTTDYKKKSGDSGTGSS